MNNIIKCDFHRTERRKEMQEIEAKMVKLINSLYDSVNLENADIDAIAEMNKLDIRYAELEKEEKEWGHVKWAK